MKVELSKEEPYMIVGGLEYLASNLDKIPTAAHRIKAAEYRKLVKRMDTNFVLLHEEVSLAS